MGVRIIDHSAEVKAKIEAAVEKGLEECGIQAEAYAMANAPVDTGNLKNSIGHAVDGDTAYIGTNVEYAPYQELGTSKTKAQPFLKPAVQNHQTEYENILADALSEVK